MFKMLIYINTNIGTFSFNKYYYTIKIILIP